MLHFIVLHHALWPGLVSSRSWERRKLWLPKDDLRDSSSWESPPLVLLRDIHSKLITQYDYKEVCAQSQSQVNEGTGTGSSSQSQVNIGTGPRPSSQDGVSHLQDPVPLSLPQFDRLVESSFVRDESSVSNADVTVIPSQFKITKQILIHWQPFRDLKLKYVGSRQEEQLSSRSQQSVVTTVEESVLKTEMSDLESQEEDAPKLILFFKPMSWLGKIRSHRRDESWSASL
jgi:hypothetical protein